MPFQYSKLVQEYLGSSAFVDSSSGVTVTDVDGNGILDACEADWRRAAAGRPLKVIAATRGKDLNDMLRGIG